MRTSAIYLQGPNQAILSPAEPLLFDTQLISVDIAAQTATEKKFTYNEKFDTSCHPLQGQQFSKLQACFLRSVGAAQHLLSENLQQWKITILYGDYTGAQTRVTLTQQGIMLDLTHLTPLDYETSMEV